MYMRVGPVQLSILQLFISYILKLYFNYIALFYCLGIQYYKNLFVKLLK